jgi:hypothetical protein
MLIDDFKYIAERVRQIAIAEGRAKCPTCQDRGHREYYDVDGCVYFTTCDTCKNPANKPSPASSS